MKENKKKILIIDDDPGTRFIFKMYLKEIGYEAYEAIDGSDGLEKIKHLSPDLILCDINMPGINGLEVIQFVNKNFINLPIITISGTGIIADVVNAIRYGAWDFIMKPISNLDIIEIQIKKAIDKSRLIKENKNYQKNLEKLVEIRTEELKRSNIEIQKMNETLEQKVEERTAELRDSLENLKKTKKKLIQSEKLAGVGQLAAGIAHEINTPVQYIGSNLEFLMDAFNDIIPILNKTDKLGSISDQKKIEKAMNEIKDEIKIADIDFLRVEIPESLKQSNEGVKQISKIVRAMKYFVHPGQKDKQYYDINTIIKNSINISRNEWKYFADLTVKYDENLPKVFCLGYEIGQVFLNLIVNAAYTIKKKIGEEGEKKGKITITIANKKEFLEIRLSDTGNGIPEKNQSRIFEPFFTTKPIGSGTGQGLSMAYAIIVNEHNGDINFETDLGKGTTFIIKLPIKMEDI